MIPKVSLRAPAKINLYLQILGRREDGYHLLASLMQKLEFFDFIEIEAAAEGITLACPDSELPQNEDNIAFRAARLFFSTYSPKISVYGGAHITLRKFIPVAAGLGGGSSDAAVVLVGLDKLFHTGIERKKLAALGASLGADVPFFVYDSPVAWATGIGDSLEPALGFENGLVLLVNPGFPVSTKFIYENFALTLDKKKINLKNSHSNDKASEKNLFLNKVFMPAAIRNDLEQVTTSLYKELLDIKEHLLEGGALCAMMSGSGPTFFALFDKRADEQARSCYEMMRKHYRQVFLVQPMLEDHCRFCSTG